MKFTTAQLNAALDLAAKYGASAKDIISLRCSENGSVVICLGLDRNGLARFVSNQSFGM